MPTKTKRSHTDRVRELASELSEMDWDETTDVNLHVHVGQREAGRFSAAEEPTNPVNKRPESHGPDSRVKGVVAIVTSVKTWQHVAALAIIAGVVAYLLWLRTR